jgi:hypothetical protein
VKPTPFASEPAIAEDTPEAIAPDGEPSEAPDAPEGAVTEARCAAACAHIFEVRTGAVAEARDADWLSDCVSRCQEFASDGQLACYERVTRAEELDVCSVF